mmetsp:Transcript_21795/g.41122  ORF Transcript_21795/g.41122 Transcript_21795/m.41122 type:complete len:222 (-) Transcript_21795:229-894(-)
MFLRPNSTRATLVSVPDHRRLGLVHKSKHKLKCTQHNSQNKNNQQSRHHGLDILGQILQNEKFPDEIHQKDDPHDGKAHAIHVLPALVQILIEESYSCEDAKSSQQESRHDVDDGSGQSRQEDCEAYPSQIHGWQRTVGGPCNAKVDHVELGLSVRGTTTQNGARQRRHPPQLHLVIVIQIDAQRLLATGELEHAIQRSHGGTHDEDGNASWNGAPLDETL